MMKNPRLVFLRLLCLCGLLFAIIDATSAPRLALAQFEHMSWTARNGAPDGIADLAQTSDGWLWLGTSQGLVRFDGMRFEPLRLTAPNRFPNEDVYALHADARGGLWIGWTLGGVSHYRNGVVRNWSTADGIPPGSMWGFAEDGDGVWAAGLEGLARFDGRSWRRVGADQGFTARKASSVFVAADGTVAVLSDLGLFLRPRGASRFEGPLGRLDARQPFQQQHAGAGAPIYLLEAGGIRIVDSLRDYEKRGRSWIYRQRGPRTGSMLADRDGTLWYNDNEGLHRSADPASAAAAPGRHHAAGTEDFGKAQGLSDNAIVTIREDGEGNVWVVTRAGIDRFRAPDVVRANAPIDDFANLAPAPGQGAIAADGERAWRLSNDGPATALPGKEGDAITVDSTGGLWLASAKEVSRRTPDGAKVLETIALPPGLSPVNKLHALARATDGSLWASLIGGGVHRYLDGKWQRAALLPDGGRKTALSMLADMRGRMWFGYMDNQVALLDGGKLKLFGKTEGLAVGKVALLAEHRGVVLAGGADGLARFDGGRFMPVTAVPAHAFDSLVGAASDGAQLWLNGAAGIVRLDAQALAGAKGGAAQVFDDSAGLRGRAGILSVGTIARAADGRIWASTEQGVFWIDPATLRPEAPPRQPAILQADADNRAYDPAQALRLPPQPQRLVLRYAAPALTAPERLHYRYRLEGYERDWQQAGRQTEAVYTGLPPGDYRFVVQALNGAGQPGPESAPLALHVAPTLVQTAWFRVASALLLALALWALYLYRLRVQERRLLALEQTRHAERDRIARELHDTLLQSVQGLILRFDAVTTQMASNDPLRPGLEAVLDQAGAVVGEARERVGSLRAAFPQGADLAAALAGVVSGVRAETGYDCAFQVQGTPAAIDAGSVDACCRIVLEGLRNACHHADAQRIGVLLHYADDALRISIADDGKGIDAATLASGRAGHWGLAGMRERAAEIGAGLHIESAPGAGTTLLLVLPRLAPRMGNEAGTSVAA